MLTGGIGSGKSAVAARLAARGAEVLAADAVGHTVLEPDGEAFAAVAARWPAVVVAGRIDRAALAGIVFADPAARRELEALTHPAIAARLAARVAMSGAEVLVIELPLLVDLVGEGWPRVVVDAPVEVRRARLAARGMDAGDIEARLRAQPAREEWLAAADFVVDNGGDFDQLEAEVARLWSWIAAGCVSVTAAR